MNVAYLCILIAALLPILLAGAAKAGGRKLGVSYDNAAPRASLSQLSGWPQRANWAQQNSWEAFPVFAAAVLMALQAGLDAHMVGLWASAFVFARCAYSVCYLLDLAVARSLCWMAGLFICMRLMMAAI
ncbi:MAPEG family protein [Uliginosibacterium aquaticum]|uniref:MAPEG family protein n=1 Tax=Uliginosibacterium aquaticum TaxID=2731212 RepID=A0ABX2IMA4_9RHOO|nr:MAPEG family protein [Uliginosibacterium aquaticum]NSL55260.1 MAPEG family protein [Uliginosibacterium aquaticum]